MRFRLTLCLNHVINPKNLNILTFSIHLHFDPFSKFQIVIYEVNFYFLKSMKFQLAEIFISRLSFFIMVSRSVKIIKFMFLNYFIILPNSNLKK